MLVSFNCTSCILHAIRVLLEIKYSVLDIFEVLHGFNKLRWTLTWSTPAIHLMKPSSEFCLRLDRVGVHMVFIREKSLSTPINLLVNSYVLGMYQNRSKHTRFHFLQFSNLSFFFSTFPIFSLL